MNLITDTISELERKERVYEYDFKEVICLLHQASKAYNKALSIPVVVVPKGTLVCDCANNLDPLSATTGVCKICDTYVDLLAK